MGASVLAYRTLGLGDFLTAVPALRALRRAFPEDQLVLATSPPLAELVPLVGGVDVVLPTGELAVPAWSGAAPALAVNLHGSGPQSHRVLGTLRPRRLLAFGCPEAGADGPQWRAGEHDVRRWCRLVAHAGLPADPDDLSLATPARPSPRPGATVVHPGAASARRRWPVDRFARVVRELRGAGHDVVVTGVADERPLAEELAAAAGLSRDAVLAGTLALDAMAALVAAARLVVCGDTGVGHLATAYGTPSVLLFGPVSPAQWGPPPGRDRHRALWHGDVRRGNAPGSDVDPALLAITPDEVLAAARVVAA